jgi:hypothetical protein
MAKKAQGALEYLITYGWAILIIVIIGGALFALGVFNPSTWSSNKRATGFSSIQVNDWKLNGTGLSLVVANKFGDAVNITNIPATRTGVTGNCHILETNGTVLASDGTSNLPVTDSGCTTGLSTGKTYALAVNVFFNAGTLDHVDAGTITGKFE